jgi:hypothetical protein
MNETFALLFTSYHIVAIDGENKVRVARDRNKTHSIALIRLDIHYGQRRARASRIATKTIDKSGSWVRGYGFLARWDMVPVVDVIMERFNKWQCQFTSQPE